MGEEVAEEEATQWVGIGSRATQYDLKLGTTKLAQGLTAKTAGRSGSGGGGGDGQSAKLADTFGNRFKECYALGTDSSAITRVFDVTTGKNAPIGRLKSGADGVHRIRSMGGPPRMAGRHNQLHVLSRTEPGS